MFHISYNNGKLAIFFHREQLLWQTGIWSSEEEAWWVTRLLSVKSLVRPAWVSWPCVKLCSVLDQVYSSAWFNKVDSPPHMNMDVEHLALPSSQRTLCSHDTVPLRSTCWSDLGQQMFQLHSISKSMTIDLEEITARIHHVVCFELWK